MKKIYIIGLIILLLTGSCSTIDNLPEWEHLYTGIKKTEVHDKKGTYEESTALSEVKGALAYAPNNSLFGSSSIRTLFPIGLWIHDSYVGKKKPSGFSKWLNKAFGSEYVTISAVNPQTRTMIATNTLQNYGYFNGRVDYKLIPEKNPRKQKVRYDIFLGDPYTYHDIKYMFQGTQDSIVKANFDKRYLKVDGQFSTADLDAERSRLATDMKDNGYYYFRDDYVAFFADSMQYPKQVELLVSPSPTAPENASKQMHIGKISVYIRNVMTQADRRQTTPTDSASRDSLRKARMRQMMTFDDSVMVYGVKFAYQGKKEPISTKVVRRNIIMRPGMLYRQNLIDRTTRNLSNMQVFRQIQWSLIPRDTTATCDTLDATITLSMDQPIDLEAEFSFTQKSNDQVGPHGKVSVSKRNAFGHGETLAFDLIGSYEWHTRTAPKDSRTPPDSYEAGMNVSLSYPWLSIPGLSKKRFRYPSSSTFKANIDHINRAGYYRLLTFGVEADYDFQTSRYIKHQVVPLTVKYNHLLQTSAEFDSITSTSSALYASLKDQFIPGIQYSFTYDNSTKKLTRRITHFDITVKEAGNITGAIGAISGQKFREKNKKIFGNPYAQFLKFSGQLINYFKLSENTTLATRLKAGVIWTYGNSTIAPYSEMFFVGGANSVRAFTARSIGPGAYYDHRHRGTYLDQAGDLHLEANVEYRFKLMSNLYGATFLDAGNVWLLRNDDAHDGGKIGDEPFLKTLALGTGVGLRYDLKFLVLRLDLGVGLHAPYDTGKTGFYNIKKLSDGLGVHFAIGYPF